MSGSVVPLKLFKVKEPRIRINEERGYTILEGGSQVSWKPVISTSFSNGSQQFNAPPPNPNIIVDRKVYLSVPVTVAFTGTAPPGQNLLQSGFDSFRAYPLSSVMTNLAVTIGTKQVSIAMSDTVQALLRYHNPQTMRDTEYSGTPSMMDQSQNYVDLMGANRNPLAPYGDGYEASRGGFPYTTFVNGNAAATVAATITEPLFLSPFLFGHGESAGFVGLQTMDFDFTYSNDLTRVWSHSAGSGSTINTITVTFGQPTLLFTYITPKELQRRPSEVPYPLFILNRYPTDAGAVLAPNAITTLTSMTVMPSAIPRRIYIFARKRNQDLTFNDTDTFLAIKNVSLTWNNTPGILASASQQDLYNISKENGCNMTWAQWSGGPSFNYSGGTNTTFGTIGSVLALDFGKDIGLSSLEAPGLLGKYQLQANVTVQNLNQTAGINPTLFIVTVLEGTFSVKDGETITNIGIFNSSEVLSSKTIPEVDYHEIEHIYGEGSFLEGLKKFTRKAVKGIKDIAPKALKAVETYGPEALKFAEMLAAGQKPAKASKALIPLSKRSSRVGGGELMSRDQMLRSIMEQM